ncbi:hypothetical protein AUK18_02520 [Candidatus Beckwithbacteria bacterium CG2_30_44_31]|uniref:Bro-N domain-containing protein n=1 Tax=Candidatus Beckwithbacteria bacterium CG2_30_44_31 TaxID=1805035 RepID=A0A1J5B8F4_9BACT|nr:MAG: hypothetical protein AUK18_02520 [Candidatus Beckwithbacteria bacterium CG2_30_44_31]
MKIAVYKGRQIRRQWDAKQEKWYFSVVDIIQALIDQPDFSKARKYWNKLAERLRQEGSEVVTNCHQLKLRAQDGKLRPTDAADVETLFRLIQSIPSPKAEPFKRWLARVGYERVQDISDPERSLNRARAYWQKHQVKETDEYAILTNIIHHEWSGLSVKGHKKYKGLNQQNLRDHMTEAELIFTALAETVKAKGLTENKPPAHKGGRIAKHARLELEQKTGKRVVTRANFLGQVKQPKRLR